MKVAFVISGLGVGGAEMSLLKLLHHSAAIDKPTVITLRGGGELVERFREAGATVQSLDMSPGLPNPWHIWRLARRLKEAKVDLVSTWMYHADLIGGMAARLAGIPVVWGVRHSDLSSDQLKWQTRLVVRACAGLSRVIPRAIIFNSEASLRTHAACGYQSEFIVIPNGFDTTRYHPDDLARDSVRKELGVPPQTALVGLVARFHPQKNHLGFLESASIVAAEKRDVHFVLVGTGVDPSNGLLNARANRAGLSGRVHLLGERQDVPRLTAALDVAVLSSHGEAFPNVLGEAMACGVSCVTTDVGEARHIVGETGLVVPKGDQKALAAGILDVLNMPPDYRRRLGQDARRRVEEQFEIGAIARRFEEAFAAATTKRETDVTQGS